LAAKATGAAPWLVAALLEGGAALAGAAVGSAAGVATGVLLHAANKAAAAKTDTRLERT